MIIEARLDVVSLRGSLSENHWDAIAAAVDLVLPEHPQGILMDCSGLTNMTDMGAATFMSGLSYMEARGARIILCSVPDAVQTRLREIPGLHSQVPIAGSIEQGRQSLDVGQSTPLITQGNVRVVLVAISPPFSSEAAAQFLRRLHLEQKAELHFIYGIIVPRSFAVGSPMPEEEALAEIALAAAEKIIPATSPKRHVVRGRNTADGLIQAATKLGAEELIAALDKSSAGDEAVNQTIAALRERCPCALTIAQEPIAQRVIGQ